MSTLYRINPDGSFVTFDNQITAPSYVSMKKFIECETLEHVSVLFDGKPAHLFVDEDGSTKELPVNERASAIYANVLRSRYGLPTYDDMTKTPPSHVKTMLEFGRPIVILGRAVLWTGNLPR